jgi:hypothetical protein
MNKIVFEHYPASKLPDDLRQEIDASATVKIVIEEEPRDGRKLPGFPPEEPRKPMTIEETLAAIRRFKDSDRPSVSPEEAVKRIRELRDEWDY